MTALESDIGIPISQLVDVKKGNSKMYVVFFGYKIY
jgi:hypothetical protein